MAVNLLCPRFCNRWILFWPDKWLWPNAYDDPNKNLAPLSVGKVSWSRWISNIEILVYFCSILHASENFKAYSISGHRHLPEIEENLSKNSVLGKVKVLFTPHLLPISRGIHASIYEITKLILNQDKIISTHKYFKYLF